MTSTDEMSMLRQQYLFSPRSSSTFAGSSPALIRDWKEANLSPMRFPHVKQRIGIIMSGYLYDFCLLRLAPGPPNFFGSACRGSPESRYLLYAFILSRISFPLTWSTKARAIAIAAASACPMNPPPETLTSTSNFSLSSLATVTGPRR